MSPFFILGFTETFNLKIATNQKKETASYHKFATYKVVFLENYLIFESPMTEMIL